jgi:hypothetical protein
VSIGSLPPPLREGVTYYKLLELVNIGKYLYTYICVCVGPLTARGMIKKKKTNCEPLSSYFLIFQGSQLPGTAGQ